MEIRSALDKIIQGQDLSEHEMFATFTQIMSGEATDTQIGALLVAMRMKGETIDEISGAVNAMRSLSTKVEINTENAVDIVGTGGDGANLFNVSTAASFVVAAAGGIVAKHGNRSVSSKSGSADVLESLKIGINLNPEQVAECIDKVGLGFMFAPMHHKAMKHAVGPRRELELRTIFNILGPMTNPANVDRQLIGVYDRKWCRPIAEVMRNIGSKHILVVHSEDGLDEISCASRTFIVELKNGAISESVIGPDDFGMNKVSLNNLVSKNADHSSKIIEDLFCNKSVLGEEIVTINAGAALYVSGIADSIFAGISLAKDTVRSGKAILKVKELSALSLNLSDK